MQHKTRTRIRLLGWVLMASFLLLGSLWILANAIADSDNLDHWANWADVLAIPLGAAGTIILITDRFKRQPTVRTDSLDEVRLTELMNLAATDPSRAVRGAWAFVSDAAQEVARQREWAWKETKVLIEALRSNQEIADDVARQVYKLRSFERRLDPEIPVSPGAARQYIRSAEKAADSLLRIRDRRRS